MLDIVPCQSCAGATTLAAEIQPFGREPGHRIYYCESCRRHTWTTWHFSQQQQPRQPQRSHADDRRERRSARS